MMKLYSFFTVGSGALCYRRALVNRNSASHVFDSNSREDVLASASRSSDWRASVQSSSNQCRGMENNVAKRTVECEGNVKEISRETMLDAVRGGYVRSGQRSPDTS